MKVLSITKRRLEYLLKRIFNGGIPTERRDGDHRSQKCIAKKESIKKFINSFPATESHYNRSKSKRIYLDSSLNIAKTSHYFGTRTFCITRIKIWRIQ